MKKFISLLFLLCSMQMYAQIPVTDAAMNANTAGNQIVNASTWGNQLLQLQQQSTFLLTTLKYVQEVNSVVRDVAYAKQLIERQQYIIKHCAKLIKNADEFGLGFTLELERTISAFLITNNSLITLITTTLTSQFRMNDSERLTILMNLKKEQEAILNELHTVDMILTTQMSTNNIIEYQIFK